MAHRPPRSPVPRNLLANLLGQGSAAVLTVAFVPSYLRLMGMEAYGLVGFLVMVQGAITVLDMGLSSTLNRELARLSSTAGGIREMRGLVAGLSRIYWGIAAGVATVFYFGGPFISDRWLTADAMSADSVTRAVRLVGLVVAFRLPSVLYMSGLMGLQRHVLLNLIRVPIAALRWGVVVLVMNLLSPSIEIFLTWQLGVVIGGTAASALALYACIPGGRRDDSLSGFDHVTRVWRFAAGVGGIGVLATILTQMDKVVLSSVLSLALFGQYMVAAMLAAGLYYVIGPVFTAVYPRLTQLVAEERLVDVRSLYHTASQTVAVVVVPLALITVGFARDILLLWTGDPELASQASSILALLVVGTALNGLVNVPYALQLAYGWTALAFVGNLIAVITLLPVTYFVAVRWGGVGAAAVWVVVNLGYVLVSVQVMHRRLLPGDKLEWYVRDVGVPASWAAVMVVLGRALVSRAEAPYLPAVVFGVWLGSMIAAAAAAPRFRAASLAWVGRL
jgi:O-antigen/teichoic acid export membrane protein